MNNSQLIFINIERFLPYNIIHINLSKQKLFTPPAINNMGKYIVIWWKEIALGDFYIKPNERLSEGEYRNKIATAILPVINLYARKANIDIDWNEFLLFNKIQGWAIKMESIFFFRVYERKAQICSGIRYYLYP